MSVGTASRLDKLLNLIEGKHWLLRPSRSISRVEHAACGAVRCIECDPGGAGGATSTICKAAARQVASTARSHPQQLPPLLQKVPSHCVHDLPQSTAGLSYPCKLLTVGTCRSCPWGQSLHDNRSSFHALPCRYSRCCSMLAGRRVLQRASASASWPSRLSTPQLPACRKLHLCQAMPLHLQVNTMLHLPTQTSATCDAGVPPMPQGKGGGHGF